MADALRNEDSHRFAAKPVLRDTEHRRSGSIRMTNDALGIRHEIRDRRVLEQRAVVRALHLEHLAAGRQLVGLNPEFLLGHLELLERQRELLEQSLSLWLKRRDIIECAHFARDPNSRVAHSTPPVRDDSLGRDVQLAPNRL